MPQAGCRSRLAQKTVPGSFTVKVLRTDYFERNIGSQIGVERLVSDAHRPATQLPKGAVRSPHDDEMLEPFSFGHKRGTLIWRELNPS
jgi:hypothetical protein